METTFYSQNLGRYYPLDQAAAEAMRLDPCAAGVIQRAIADFGITMFTDVEVPGQVNVHMVDVRVSGSVFEFALKIAVGEEVATTPPITISSGEWVEFGTIKLDFTEHAEELLDARMYAYFVMGSAEIFSMPASLGGLEFKVNRTSTQFISRREVRSVGIQNEQRWMPFLRRLPADYNPPPFGWCKSLDTFCVFDVPVQDKDCPADTEGAENRVEQHKVRQGCDNYVPALWEYGDLLSGTDYGNPDVEPADHILLKAGYNCQITVNQKDNKIIIRPKRGAGMGELAEHIPLGYKFDANGENPVIEKPVASVFAPRLDTIPNMDPVKTFAGAFGDNIDVTTDNSFAVSVLVDGQELSPGEELDEFEDYKYALVVKLTDQSAVCDATPEPVPSGLDRDLCESEEA